MTQDEIIEMARQASFTKPFHEFFPQLDVYVLEAFAKLVRNDYSNKHAQLWIKRIDEAVKAEREACAKFVDHILKEGGGTWGDSIRARGQA